MHLVTTHIERGKLSNSERHCQLGGGGYVRRVASICSTTPTMETRYVNRAYHIWGIHMPSSVQNRSSSRLRSVGRASFRSMATYGIQIALRAIICSDLVAPIHGRRLFLHVPSVIFPLDCHISLKASIAAPAPLSRLRFSLVPSRVRPFPLSGEPPG
ncbi:hypothetical protein DFP72DRAFT_85843 [Ephemerocybe angulata]|uniref:Uncharacterized protein n=1 Tax=Ephemerocybe angulata TaxID=980116 RepID=A0A8H6LUD3_9AGAR|nr:hypothetical protein DFP72DRAFT_85843 [Tulosesus angulatus]